MPLDGWEATGVLGKIWGKKIYPLQAEKAEVMEAWEGLCPLLGCPLLSLYRRCLLGSIRAVDVNLVPLLTGKKD